MTLQLRPCALMGSKKRKTVAAIRASGGAQKRSALEVASSGWPSSPVSFAPATARCCPPPPGLELADFVGMAGKCDCGEDGDGDVTASNFADLDLLLRARLQQHRVAGP